MTDSPLGVLAYIVLAVVLGGLWRQDVVAAGKAAGKAAGNVAGDGAARGAGGRGLLFFGVAGGIALTLLETAGELVLGVSSEQKNITVLFLGAMLAAAVVEEAIFRGWLVVEGRGRKAQWAGAVGVSLLFAAGHDFLWQYAPDAGAAWWEFWRGFSLSPTPKGWLSFGAAFACGLFFYALRFHPRNAARALLPCIAAHAARNLAVFAVKLAQGHVVGWW
ncbi:MAG: CPBP family intramembrane metalloprotease [Puniceicoccales bacterium]|jgi:membrane protease YdiL (CAAX protease family)|nr:CPBP family intramembrane metalloprotease [Puniceicoccales bacterium]